MTFVLYCDESGNTGANFLDRDQPIFVLGGWFFERNESYRANSLIEKLKRENFQQAKELKGSRLLKSEKGRKFCVETIEKLFDLGGVPFNIVVDKRYLVYAKLVDWFLDPEYNSKLTMSFLWDNNLRKNIADILQNACSECEDIFKIVYKNPTILNIKELNHKLVSELRKSNLNELANVFENEDLDYEQILDEILIGINSEEKSAMSTVNYTVFNSFINLVEQFGRKAGLKNIRFYHDNVAQFTNAFPTLFKLYKENKDKGSISLLGGNEIVFSATTIKFFEMRDSQKNYLIQAADILSSTLNYYMTEKYMERELSASIKRMDDFVKKTILLSSMDEYAPFTDYIASKKLINVLSNNRVEENQFEVLYQEVIKNLDKYLSLANT